MPCSHETHTFRCGILGAYHYPYISRQQAFVRNQQRIDVKLADFLVFCQFRDLQENGRDLVAASQQTRNSWLASHVHCIRFAERDETKAYIFLSSKPPASAEHYDLAELLVILNAYYELVHILQVAVDKLLDYHAIYPADTLGAGHDSLEHLAQMVAMVGGAYTAGLHLMDYVRRICL